MNGTNEILNELRSLSPAVAEISHQTPYAVPEGYFNGFPGLVLERVAGWKDAKSLIYSVPEGYFDQFAQGVLAKIKAGSVLEAIGRVTPYQAPEGYFEELSPLLALCRDKNPYAVPEGYFERLSEAVMARTGQSRVTKAVVRRMSWMKYSVAAVLAGLIFTVGWLRWQHAASGSSHPAYDVATLSKVSDAELQNFLTDQDTTLALPLSNMTATVDMNDIDIKALLGDVPDGELKQYMEEQGGASDIGTN